MQHLETPRSLRGLVVVRKPDLKPTLVNRLELWFSTGRKVDGLWIGTRESKPQSGLRRIEDALRLIEDHHPLDYDRILHNLDRIWVHLLPSSDACYEASLNACVFDERFVLLETTTLERIASTIVHEATHARLERWGIFYHERQRSRIEAICLRRELNFLTSLPHSEELQEEIAGTLAWCAKDHDYFSDESFQQRDDQGQVETLRYLGAPGWVISLVMRIVRKRRLRVRAAPNR